MEFLLINHPLDCPICDQGGECELQDLAVGFGRDVSRFVERKRVVKDKNLGPLVSTDMTRCIHCTRCVRFGQDIAGIQELGATGRGEHMEIGTYIEHSVDHELSGNIIDLCPVGALNSKPFRYRGRGWEMTQHPLVSPHDGVGTQLYGHVLRGRLMRVVPRPCEEINETWIADRDRFSYEGIYSEDRLLAPQLRQRRWQLARGRVGSGARRRPRQRSRRSRPAQLGLLAHPSSTLEELYLLARLAEGLGSANIDHRLRQRDFRDAGSSMRASPQLGHADRRHRSARGAAGGRARICATRCRSWRTACARPRCAAPGQLPQSGALRVSVPGGAVPASRLADELVGELAAVLRAALGDAAAAAPSSRRCSRRVRAVGDDASRHRATRSDAARAARSGSGRWPRAAAATASCARWRARWREATGASLGELAEGGNAAGAYLAGVLPHRGAGGAARASAGRNARQMLEQPLPGYLLLQHRALGRCGCCPRRWRRSRGRAAWSP